ncbi:hypothetical protein JM946_29720 [Steroidobacter sp. S1-65]|uniref:Uncharacterized protein n=1 Tax=Steroidobacter gossypii TaxID=2805490 RepID=A0ABS1X6S3_9GAMM|nr:hypothetical protein [Steroidobacter gossypii]MBM0108926.1 hypothetical protein [Steroidobacter gossypii]
MNDIERESIILNSAWEMIEGMVNWAMFVSNDLARPTDLAFVTHQHSLLFSILLGDFLSQVQAFKGSPVPLGLKAVPSNSRPADRTFIFHLRQVCANPKLGTCTTRLRNEIDAFADWLEGDFVVPRSTCIPLTS